MAPAAARRPQTSGVIGVTSWPRRHPRWAVAASLAVLLGGIWTVKLVHVVRSIERSAQFWAAPRGQAGGLVYVALGDSAAQGIGASAPEHGYVAVLAERLRAATGQPVQVINLSESGAEIADVLATQLPALAQLGVTPDLLTVGIGGNDLRAYDATTFAAHAAELTALLPEGAYIADSPYFMHGRWERDAQQAADLMHDQALEQGLRPVPLHQFLMDQGWQAMLTQFAADWFHPNDRGHQVWADAFWSVIQPDLASGRLSQRPR